MIYDCFMFFKDLDLLEIRLNVLSEVVDLFVLVEARQTHQRGTKPLYYTENRRRFEPFSDRIAHIVVDEFPKEAIGAAACESWQRNAIRLGLQDVEFGDTVLISDVDEIPRPESVVTASQRPGVSVFRQVLFRYFLNCRTLSQDGSLGGRWGGTVAYRHNGRTKTPERYSELRNLRGWKGDRPRYRLRGALRRVRRAGAVEGQARFLDDAGWHFSYLGGVSAIIAKLEAYSHAEFNTEEFKDPASIFKAMEGGGDLLGRGARHEWVPVDGRFPMWLQETAATRYVHLLAPAEWHATRRPRSEGA